MIYLSIYIDGCGDTCLRIRAASASGMESTGAHMAYTHLPLARFLSLSLSRSLSSALSFSLSIYIAV